MATNFHKIKKGIKLTPVTGSTVTEKGDVAFNDTSNKVEIFNDVGSDSLVSETKAATLTNKTLSGNTATNLVSGSGTLTLNTSGTVTAPNTTDTLVGKATTDTLTNKTLSGNIATNLVSGAATVTLPTATGTLATLAGTETLTGKTLSGNIATNLVSGAATVTLPTTTGTLATLAGTEALTNKDLDGGTAANTRRVTLPKDTIANLQTLTRKEGTIVYATDQAKPYFDTGSALSAIGSGSGGSINHITDGDFEATSNAAQPTIATRYDDGAATPVNGPAVDGTNDAAAGNTFLASTSQPLRGTKSALLAGNAVGEGVSFLHTMPRADFASMQEIEFDYEITTTDNFTQGDVTVWVYDVTNSTLIQPTPYIVGKSTGQEKFKAVFQSSATGASYRLLIHQAAVTGAGSSLKVDSIRVGPQTGAPLGAPMEDWNTNRTFTPSAGFTTISLSTILSRRVGDSLQVKGTFKFAGVAGSAASIGIPLAIDFTKLTTLQKGLVGRAQHIESGGSAALSITEAGTGELLNMFTDGSTTGQVYMSSVTGAETFVKRNVNAFASAGDSLSFEFEVPILGWSSNVQMSDSADTRVVAMNYGGLPTGTFNTSEFNATTFPTKLTDTHAAYSGSTYTVPVKGHYNITVSVDANASAPAVGSFYVIGLSIDGGAPIYTRLYFTDNATNTESSALTMTINAIPLNAGQTLQVQMRGAGSMGTLTYAASTGANHFSIVKAGGPSAIAATETVAVKYQNTAGTSITSSTATVPFATKVYDTHGAFDGSTFTAPVAGKYQITVNTWMSVNLSTAQESLLNFLVTSTPESLTADQQFSSARPGVGATKTVSHSVSRTYNLAAGNTIAVQLQSDVTTTLNSTAGRNAVTIVKVGNY